MKKRIRVSMYSKIGTLGLTILMIVCAILALMWPDVGLSVILVWCLLILLFKLDIMTIEIIKLREGIERKEGGK